MPHEFYCSDGGGTVEAEPARKTKQCKSCFEAVLACKTKQCKSCFEAVPACKTKQCKSCFEAVPACKTKQCKSIGPISWNWHCCSLHYFDGLVQQRRNSSALAMELRLSCTNPSIWSQGHEFILEQYIYLKWHSFGLCQNEFVPGHLLIEHSRNSYLLIAGYLYFSPTSLRRKCHFNEIFITDCTGCDNFLVQPVMKISSKWRLPIQWLPFGWTIPAMHCDLAMKASSVKRACIGSYF